MNTVYSIFCEPCFSGSRWLQANAKEKAAENLAVSAQTQSKMDQLMTDLRFNPADFQIVMRNQESPPYEYRLPKTLILSQKIARLIENGFFSPRDKVALARILYCLSRQITPIDAEKNGYTIFFAYNVLFEVGALLALRHCGDNSFAIIATTHLFGSSTAVLASKLYIDQQKAATTRATDRFIAKTSPELAREAASLLQTELEEKKEMRRAYLSRAYPNSCWGRFMKRVHSLWVIIAYTDTGESQFDSSSPFLRQRIKILQRLPDAHPRVPLNRRLT